MANKTKLKRAIRKQLKREQARVVYATGPSRPRQPDLLPSHQRPAADTSLLDGVDSLAPLRNKLRELAGERGEWAGIPMPLEGERLVIEPRYPYAALSKIGPEHEPADPEVAGMKVRNTFWCTRRMCDVIVIEKPNGRITYGIQPGMHHLDKSLRTLGCSEAWGIEQEQRALQLLGTMVNHRKFKQYLLTGSFVERSHRSGVVYLFRRLKPTVAIRSDAQTNTTRVMCALCMHPIGYYEGTWAGAMTPSDDVVAHLSLMRADEAMYWRRANQHPAYRPEAGL